MAAGMAAGANQVGAIIRAPIATMGRHRSITLHRRVIIRRRSIMGAPTIHHTEARAIPVLILETTTAARTPPLDSARSDRVGRARGRLLVDLLHDDTGLKGKPAEHVHLDPVVLRAGFFGKPQITRLFTGNRGRCGSRHCLRLSDEGG